MTKHTRTAPPVDTRQEESLRDRRHRQYRADALLDAAAPLRYVPSMGKRLRQSEWSDAMKRDARWALIAWNKP